VKNLRLKSYFRQKQPTTNSRYKRFADLVELTFFNRIFVQPKILGFKIRKPLVAPRRYGQVEPKIRRRKSLKNMHLFPQKKFKAEARKLDFNCRNLKIGMEMWKLEKQKLESWILTVET
jgi:hypothetical protein